MSIKTKVVISICLTGGLTLAFIVALFQWSQHQTLNDIGKKQRIAINRQITKTIENHEKTVELHLFSALNAIRGDLKNLKEQDIKNETLAKLANRYFISSLYIINNEGRISKGSDYELLKQKGFVPGFSLFDFCPEERGLIGTQNIFKKSPMLWIPEIHDPSKYYWTYLKNKNYFLEVTYLFHDLDDIFRQIVSSFDEILEISLLTPSHKIMASSIERAEQVKRNEITKKVEYRDHAVESDNKILVYTSFGQRYKDYCSVPEKDYYYTLLIAYKPIRSSYEVVSKQLLAFAPAGFLLVLLLIYIVRILNGATNLKNKMIAYMKSSMLVKHHVNGDEIKQMHYMFDILKDYISQLLEKEKRMSKYQAIGQTTQFLAHDIRKPFSQLKIIVRLIRTTNRPEEVVKKYIPSIEYSANKVNSLLTDIMDFGTVKVKIKKPISLLHLINHNLRNEVGIHSSKDIKLIYSLEHKTLVEGNFEKLSRAFCNILNNAVEATPTNGFIEISSFETESMVTVSILNSGSYIPSEKINTLFEPFVTHKEGGTGLGLAITKEILEAHGGSIVCESSKSNGTKFSLSFRRVNQKDQHYAKFPKNIKEIRMVDGDFRFSDREENIRKEEKLAKKIREGNKPVSICMIDDDALYTHAISSMLENIIKKTDKIMLTTLNHIANLDDLNKYLDYDLFIVDVDLGGEYSGEEVVRKLKSMRVGSYICFHTDHISKKIVNNLKNLGADLITPKPMSYEVLLNIIDTLTDRTNTDLS